jgi:hypothetical protein
MLIMKDKKRSCKNIIDIVNILECLDSLDSFWYPSIIENLLDSVLNKYIEYEKDEFYDDSEKFKSLNTQVVKWIEKNDGIILMNGEFLNLVKDGDHWLLGKINADNYETAEKIISLINKLYKIYNDLRD